MCKRIAKECKIDQMHSQESIAGRITDTGLRVAVRFGGRGLLGKEKGRAGAVIA